MDYASCKIILKISAVSKYLYRRKSVSMIFTKYLLKHHLNPVGYRFLHCSHYSLSCDQGNQILFPTPNSMAQMHSILFFLSLFFSLLNLHHVQLPLASVRGHHIPFQNLFRRRKDGSCRHDTRFAPIIRCSNMLPLLTPASCDLTRYMSIFSETPYNNAVIKYTSNFRHTVFFVSKTTATPEPLRPRIVIWGSECHVSIFLYTPTEEVCITFSQQPHYDSKREKGGKRYWNKYVDITLDYPHFFVPQIYYVHCIVPAVKEKKGGEKLDYTSWHHPTWLSYLCTYCVLIFPYTMALLASCSDSLTFSLFSLCILFFSMCLLFLYRPLPSILYLLPCCLLPFFQHFFPFTLVRIERE